MFPKCRRRQTVEEGMMVRRTILFLKEVRSGMAVFVMQTRLHVLGKRCLYMRPVQRVLSQALPCSLGGETISPPELFSSEYWELF